jgi:hypothetical protein
MAVKASEEKARASLLARRSSRRVSIPLICFLGAEPADGRSTSFVRGLLDVIPGEFPPRT